MQNQVVHSIIYSAASDKNLLIIHGFMGMSDNWKTLGLQYQEAGYNVHILDLRNHGKSFHSDDFSYEAMVQDVVNYCQVNHIQSAHVIGHSMGGKVAMLLATSHPELIQKCVVADIGPKYYAPHHQDILAGLNAIDFSVQPSRSDVEETLYPYIPDFGTRQFLLKNLFWITPGQLAFRFNLPVFNARIEEIGKALPSGAVFLNPTLFIRGGNSNYILDADFNAIKDHFPNAVFETIPNVGHWLHAENPKSFFEYTTQFLN